MTLDAARLAAFAALAVGLTWAAYWPSVRRLRVARRPLLEQGAMTGSAILALLALLSSPGLIAAAVALLALSGSGFFLYTTLNSRLPMKPVAVRPGDSFIDFTTRDWKGEEFRLSSLAGRPFLLKFYRGYWCPYCVAELEHWEAMRPRLESLGVTLVTVSPDDVEETARLRDKHRFGMTMLSDASLVVTSLYNVRHEKGLAATPGKRGVFRPLAMPTAILVDAHGIVRWVDQTDDYRIRSAPERVFSAVQACLGGETRDRAND